MKKTGIGADEELLRTTAVVLREMVKIIGKAYEQYCKRNNITALEKLSDGGRYELSTQTLNNGKELNELKEILIKNRIPFVAVKGRDKTQINFRTLDSQSVKFAIDNVYEGRFMDMKRESEKSQEPKKSETKEGGTERAGTQGAGKEKKEETVQTDFEKSYSKQVLNEYRDSKPTSFETPYFFTIF